MRRVARMEVVEQPKSCNAAECVKTCCTVICTMIIGLFLSRRVETCAISFILRCLYLTEETSQADDPFYPRSRLMPV